MQTKSTGHILSATILFGVFVVLFFAQYAHASVIFDTTDDSPVSYFAVQTFGDKSAGLVWYNASTTFVGNSFTTKADAQVFDVPITLRIYDVTGNIEMQNPGEDAPVVAVSSPVLIEEDSGNNSALWPEYTFTFPNTTFTFGRAYMFAFQMAEADHALGTDIRFTVAEYSYDSLWYFNEYNEFDHNDLNSSTTTLGYMEENWAIWGLLEGAGIQEDEYLVTFAPCATDTRGEKQCEETAEFAEFMTYDANINTTQENRKLEIHIEDTNGRILDSVGYYYEEPGYYNVNTQFAMVFGSSTNAIYFIRSCLLPADEFSIFTPGDACTTMVYGNGTSTEGYISWWTQRNENTPNAGLSAFEELGCADLSVTEVGKAVRCGLLWAFEPSLTSVNKFANAKNMVLTSYPIGYFTYMWADINTALQSTSTDIFTREVELGKYFGRPDTATTTFTLSGTETYIEKIKPVSDKIDMLLWIGFSAWFVVWAVTRKL